MIIIISSQQFQHKQSHWHLKRAQPLAGGCGVVSENMSNSIMRPGSMLTPQQQPVRPQLPAASLLRTCGLYCLGTRLAMAAYTPLVVVVTYVNSVT
jgi:hypothetical protein